MKKGRWITRDGLRLRVGSHAWKWWRRNRRAINGQSPLRRPPKHTPLEVDKKIVAFAHAGLGYAGRMTYDESGRRSDLFHRRPGDFNGAHADCSQFVSAILHWVGVRSVTDTDFTGTLLTKGRQLTNPRSGAVVVWGPGTGTHTAFITERAGTSDWWCVGFGHQGAPDRVTLSAMNSYFSRIGHPGVRFLNLTTP